MSHVSMASIRAAELAPGVMPRVDSFSESAKEIVSKRNQAAMTAASNAVFAGTLDDGSMSHGISGITAANEAAGMQVEEVGISETKDETITRVKWYCGLALFSLKGLAALKGVTN